MSKKNEEASSQIDNTVADTGLEDNFGRNLIINSDCTVQNLDSLSSESVQESADIDTSQYIPELDITTSIVTDHSNVNNSDITPTNEYISPADIEKLLDTIPCVHREDIKSSIQNNENETSYINEETCDENIEKKSEFFKKIKSVDSLLDYELPKCLTTSSISLNENHNTDKLQNAIMCKSPISRSAENISRFEISETASNNITNLNTEKILDEFTNQKTKVAAVQKIPDNSLLDARYHRLNKEVLTQDLGNIVKNVHGIFSSVSGSLKSAYTISQKASTQFIYPVSKSSNVSPKNVVNVRLINDIFETEDEREKTSEDQERVTVNNDNIHIEVQNAEPESDIRGDMVKLQVESLERVLAEQRREMASLRERVRQQSDEMLEKDQMFKELEGKMDLMSKRVEQASREKDNAVMRYASGECATIEAKRAAEVAQRAEKAALAEVELLNNKLKSAHAEKQRICQLYDDKCHELSNADRELGKVREDMKELDGRLKWTQSKLRLEMDAYKESFERAEKLSQQVSELEAAKEAALLNAVETQRAKLLESDLKESRASLILCRHEKEDLERRVGALLRQLDLCRRELEEARTSLAEHKIEVERLSGDNVRLEEEAASLAGLRAQASLADALTAELERERSRSIRAEEELVLCRARAESCARREAGALEHAARVTAGQVADTDRRERAEAKACALSADNAGLRERASALEADLRRLEGALAEEAHRRRDENRALARKIAELTEESEEANKRLEWEKGENGVLRKRHASAIKELNRELQRALKRCEQLEAKRTQPELELEIRTGSVSSLSSGEGGPHPTAAADQLTNGHGSEDMPDIQVRSPSRQVLIERIVSLQRAAARRGERCEFLEEHGRQLTAELRRKSGLLRRLLCEMPQGALASSGSDQHKKEIARLGGGAMAAVWGGDAGGITLDLSIEMNRRLQAVLEDTLLKNITLKESMDTLGEEIARLKSQNTTTPTDTN